MPPGAPPERMGGVVSPAGALLGAARDVVAIEAAGVEVAGVEVAAFEIAGAGIVVVAVFGEVFGEVFLGSGFAGAFFFAGGLEVGAELFAGTLLVLEAVLDTPATCARAIAGISTSNTTTRSIFLMPPVYPRQGRSILAL